MKLFKDDKTNEFFIKNFEALEVLAGIIGEKTKKMEAELNGIGTVIAESKIFIHSFLQALEELEESEPQKAYYVEYLGRYGSVQEFYRNQENAKKRAEDLKENSAVVCFIKFADVNDK